MKKLYWKGRLMAPLLDNLARVLLLYLVVVVFDLIIVLFICHGSHELFDAKSGRIMQTFS